MAKTATIGLVVPFARDEVPAEGALMYPGTTFLARGVGVETLDHAGYEAAMARVLPAAEDLARRGAEAVMVIGTSLTFYRGAAFNARVIEKIRAATGLPASTMSTAVVEALRAVGATRLAVATAYADDVNRMLRDFLLEEGFAVLALAGFGLRGFSDPHRKSEEEIVTLSARVCAEAPEADGLLISCGGLRTLDLAVPLEARHRVPVVSSMPAGFWAALRLAGGEGRVPGYGRLLDPGSA